MFIGTNAGTALVAPATAGPVPVVALHCSGADGGQWHALGQALGPACALAAPEHYGCPRIGPWTGGRAFTLADEAARTIDLIDRGARSVHLVGHSYGGAVALHVALARPERIASVALYEPSAFHLLKAIGEQESAAFAEIAAQARATTERVLAGELSRAAAAFVDYWSGAGSWAALRPAAQAALVRWVPKAALDYRALIAEPTGFAAYAGLHMPVLVMRGARAPRPSRAIAERLPSLLTHARLEIVDGAGHMGPLTHAAAVNALTVAHIEAAEAQLRRGARSPAERLS